VTATGRRVEFLARAIVNRLEDRGLVEWIDAEAGIVVVTKTLEENLLVVEVIERDARQKLGDRATDGEVELEMRRIAAERNVTL
jgi:hypothetical protein